MLGVSDSSGKVKTVQLQVANDLHTFTPVKAFRQTYQLPADFGVALFEPKDYSGLGRVDQAGAELNIVRQAVLDALPAQMPLFAWLDFIPSLAQLFQNKLDEINPEVGLKNVEIEYAVAGFRDVMLDFLYAMLRARSASEPMPDFRQVYFKWLSSTVRISSDTHHYIHEGEMWAVQIVNHAYGRTGLVVWTPQDTHYIQDSAQGCPAEGFMSSLLTDVAKRIAAATI